MPLTSIVFVFSEASGAFALFRRDWFSGMGVLSLLACVACVEAVGEEAFGAGGK